jgi:hypothetical protein
MATKAKKSTPTVKRKTDQKRGSNDAAYTRLRTILDSLEIGAIRYFANAPTAGEKQKRTDEMTDAMMPIIQFLWSQPGGVIECPEGYTDCNGVCVPYPCPNWP